jgi:hypothetical protein
MKKTYYIIILLILAGLDHATGQWAVNGTNISNTNSGFVGIGNNSPATLLYVAKNMTEPCITIRNMGGNGGATYTMSDVASGANWKFKVTNTGGFKIRDNANSLDIVTIEPNSFANALYVKSSDNIGIGTSSPQGSAAFDISSTNKGFLPPRMTHAQMENFVEPANGLMVFCTDCGYDGIGRPAMFMAGYWFVLDAVKCNGVPTATEEGSHILRGHIITWNWESVPAATTYKLNTTDDYNTAVNLGNVTSYTETGLESLTTYTRYVWALNDCGISESTVLTGTTPTWGCYDSLTINHVAGDVAPVTKTVTYGTTTNIPGEPAKCWITSNLGADQQATAVNDATEASAGWYWRYNTMRGYMHDGTARTPNDTWTAYVNEDSDWLPANDPCAIELGNGWRLPVNTEWNNLIVTNGWMNWNGPWSTALKLNAPGILSNTDGTLGGRGSFGIYWSSTQYNMESGGNFFLNNGYIWVSGNNKGDGLSIRCIK